MQRAWNEVVSNFSEGGHGSFICVSTLGRRLRFKNQELQRRTDSRKHHLDLVIGNQFTWSNQGTRLTEAKALRSRARSNFPVSLFPILKQDKNKGLSARTIQWISSH